MRWVILVIAIACVQVAAAKTPRVVMELFTSQGCSSCPPADALVGRLTSNPDVLALSFHVDYWDDLGWKDTFSSKASTDRQYAYARALGERSVFTPQLVVNGSRSLIGSQDGVVQHAVDAVKDAFPVQAELSRQPDGAFTVNLAGPAVRAEVWEVRYVRKAATQIRNGENGGRTLETFNNVTRIRRLGAFAPGTLKLPPLQSPDDGVAVVIQAPGAGKVLGAAAY
jgi:hypothetical protein